MQKMKKRGLFLRIPEELYEKLRQSANKESKTISSYVRNAIEDKIEEETFTPEEIELILNASREFKKGKGIDWREI